MTKRDYVLIARVINEFSRYTIDGVPNTAAIARPLARKFASELLNTNPRFDPVVFIEACVKPPEVTSVIGGKR